WWHLRRRDLPSCTRNSSPPSRERLRSEAPGRDVERRQAGRDPRDRRRNRARADLAAEPPAAAAGRDGRYVPRQRRAEGDDLRAPERSVDARRRQRALRGGARWRAGSPQRAIRSHGPGAPGEAAPRASGRARGETRRALLLRGGAQPSGWRADPAGRRAGGWKHRVFGARCERVWVRPHLPAGGNAWPHAGGARIRGEESPVTSWTCAATAAAGPGAAGTRPHRVKGLIHTRKPCTSPALSAGRSAAW